MSESETESILEALVRLERFTRAWPLRRARPVALRVASLEDLLLLKLDADRPQDIDDILAIKDVARDGLDMTYVRERAAELGVLDRLELYFG